MFVLSNQAVEAASPSACEIVSPSLFHRTLQLKIALLLCPIHTQASHQSLIALFLLIRWSGQGHFYTLIHQSVDHQSSIEIEQALIEIFFSSPAAIEINSQMAAGGDVRELEDQKYDRRSS